MTLRHLAVAVLFVALFTTCALAGPPLVCHTFDIGDAKSLPWIGHNWNLVGSESYDTKNLPADALSILDADSTALVHMETLRRAAMYGQKDPGALKQVLLRLIARAENSPSNALLIFDEGYFVEVLKQVHWIDKGFSNPAQTLDGYAAIQKALQLRRNDAQMQFAAALVTLDGPVSDHQQHAQAAIAGAQTDPLLARNLTTHFMSPQSETMAQMLSRKANVKVARK